VTEARLPVAIPAEVAQIAADVPDGILNDTFRLACERFDRYIGALAVELSRTLELPSETPLSPDRLTRERGWDPGGRLALRWLLETLETYGFASASVNGWELDAAPAPQVPAAETAADAVASLPETAPTYAIFELCARTLPAVLAGAASGEATLFSPSALALWFDYFANSNPHYALNNTLAAATLARAVPAAASILEVGGGGGSAAQAALAALGGSGKPPLRYHFTELHPAFLRRGTRVALAAAAGGSIVTAARYDIDGEPAAQGQPEGQIDAILAVNTLHLARDLVLALARLRSLLRPGGTLVLGELLRPSPAAGVHIELPFTLLEAYRSAPTDDGMRPRPGFMAAEGWRRALLAAGFSRVAVVPAALSRCVELYPGFYCGAISAS
jgi:SAM-dependent methyltransferase